MLKDMSLEAGTQTESTLMEIFNASWFSDSNSEIFAWVCVMNSTWWEMNSQPGRVHHTQGALDCSQRWFCSKDVQKKGEDWPNSCEADSPSELSNVTHWTYPATCFWEEEKISSSTWMGDSYENWWKLEWFDFRRLSFYCWDELHPVIGSLEA